MKFKVGDIIIDETGMPEERWEILKVDQSAERYFAKYYRVNDSRPVEEKWYSFNRMEVDSRVITPLEELL